MQESAKAALSYIRSNYKELGIAANFFKNKEIHAHVPEGAVPKDGPSAGITIAAAIISAAAQKPIKGDVAMTGEITLRGNVLPIGGLKEKLLAARRAGVKTVLVPKDNERDLEEISEEIKKELNIVPVKTFKEALPYIFREAKKTTVVKSKRKTAK